MDALFTLLRQNAEFHSSLQAWSSRAEVMIGSRSRYRYGIKQPSSPEASLQLPVAIFLLKNKPRLTWVAAFRCLAQNNEIKGVWYEAGSSRCAAAAPEQCTRPTSTTPHPNRGAAPFFPLKMSCNCPSLQSHPSHPKLRIPLTKLTSPPLH